MSKNWALLLFLPLFLIIVAGFTGNKVNELLENKTSSQLTKEAIELNVNDDLKQTEITLPENQTPVEFEKTSNTDQNIIQTVPSEYSDEIVVYEPEPEVQNEEIIDYQNDQYIDTVEDSSEIYFNSNDYCDSTYCPYGNPNETCPRYYGSGYGYQNGYRCHDGGCSRRCWD